MDLVGINVTDSDRKKYNIKLLSGNTMLGTKDLLKERNVPYIGSITISSEDYTNKSEQIGNTMLP